MTDPHFSILGATSDPATFADGIYFHSKDHPALAALWYWPNFSPDEPRLFDRFSGGFYWHCPSMDALQRTRDTLARPLRVLSGHRGMELNRHVGGAARSAHKRLAFDVWLPGSDRANADMVEAGIAMGFTSVGLYPTFVHFDMRPGRVWGAAPWARRTGLTVPTIRQMITDTTRGRHIDIQTA